METGALTRLGLLDWHGIVTRWCVTRLSEVMHVVQNTKGLLMSQKSMERKGEARLPVDQWRHG